MTERALSLNEFMDAVRPTLEAQVDEWILEQSPADRRLLMLQRERIVRELVRTTEIVNLRHRLAEAEARLKPRLVED
jgi:hypothetical protein